MEDAINNLKTWAEDNDLMFITEGDDWFFGKRHRIIFIDNSGKLYEYFLRPGRCYGGIGYSLYNRRSISSLPLN